MNHRSDLVSLGIIFYEIFTGATPFTGGSALGLMYQRMHEEPRDPREAWPECPEYVARVILKCLARDTASRLR